MQIEEALHHQNQVHLLVEDGTPLHRRDLLLRQTKRAYKTTNRYHFRKSLLILFISEIVVFIENEAL